INFPQNIVLVMGGRVVVIIIVVIVHVVTVIGFKKLTYCVRANRCLDSTAIVATLVHGANATTPVWRAVLRIMRLGMTRRMGVVAISQVVFDALVLTGSHFVPLRRAAAHLAWEEVSGSARASLPAIDCVPGRK